VLRPEDLIRKEILDLSAYHVPESGGMVKLDAMENPYSLPAPVRAELGAALAEVAINRYPDAHAGALKQRLREVMKIPTGMDLLLGNGSDEIIQIIAMALSQPGATLLSVEPSFLMYKMVAAFCGLNYVGVQLRADFSLDLGAMLAALRQHKPAVVFLAYPNNPTGNLFERREMAAVLAAAPGLVVSDEAYFPFNNESFLSELPRAANLLVMRTVSKMGLAGLRLGFLMGRPQWLQQFEKVRMPYNINSLTQAAALRLLGDGGVLLRQTEAIRAARTELARELAAIKGIETFASAANFVLFRVREADRVFDALKQRGILLKNLSRAHPLLANCLRATVGTPEENVEFLRALRESLIP
jgi:histidinol-phosphate aminotransferase